MRKTIIAATLTLPFAALPALAAGSGSSTPPKPTATSEKCADGMVFDEKADKCVEANSSGFTDDDRYEAARELAWAGRYDSAIQVMDSATDQNDPRFLNYRGFTARKQGDMDSAMRYYKAALAIDPDHVLARSYMGQGLVEQGDLVGALTQLREIEARGGRDTWAWAALDQALRGQATDY